MGLYYCRLEFLSSSNLGLAHEDISCTLFIRGYSTQNIHYKSRKCLSHTLNVCKQEKKFQPLMRQEK